MEKLIRIEQYLTGALGAQEAQAFEQEMQSDADLSAEVGAVQELISGIDSAGKAQFEAKVASWEASFQQAPARGRVIRPQWVRYASVAAAAVLLLAVVYFVGINDPTMNPETLLVNNLAPYPDELTILGTGTQSYDQPLANRAMGFYTNQQYEASISRLDSLITQAPGVSLFQLYKGTAFLHLEQYDDAVQALTIAAQTQGKYTQAASWYLALALLGKGETAAAKAAFQQIKDEAGHFYQAQAQKVWKSL